MSLSPLACGAWAGVYMPGVGVTLSVAGTDTLASSHGHVDTRAGARDRLGTTRRVRRVVDAVNGSGPVRRRTPVGGLAARLTRAGLAGARLAGARAGAQVLAGTRAGAGRGGRHRARGRGSRQVADDDPRIRASGRLEQALQLRRALEQGVVRGTGGGQADPQRAVAHRQHHADLTEGLRLQPDRHPAGAVTRARDADDLVDDLVGH